MINNKAIAHSGMGLTGVMIAGALLSIVALGTAEMFSRQNKAMQGMRTASNRDQLVARVARLAGNGPALDKSAKTELSSDFGKCAEGTGGGCTGNTELDFNLYDPSGTAVTGYYDANGARCGTASSAQCPIRVQTSFKATCPDGSNSCARAKSILVSYKIWQELKTGTNIGTPLRDVTGNILSTVPFETVAAGSPGYLARWSSGSEMVSSVIYQDPTKSHLGINTTNAYDALTMSWGTLSFDTFGYVSSYRNPSNSYTNLFLGGAISDNSDGNYTVHTDGGSNYFAAVRMDNSGGNAGAINFYTGASTGGNSAALTQSQLESYKRMSIVGSKVGIGTASPQATLDVNGSIRPMAATLGAACSPMGLQAYNSASGAPIYCSNALVWTAVGSLAGYFRCICNFSYQYMDVVSSADLTNKICDGSGMYLSTSNHLTKWNCTPL